MSWPESQTLQVRQPQLALSIRQPWAWLILYAGKDIENRCWRTSFRGRILIHAAKGCTRQEWQEAYLFVKRIYPGVMVPTIPMLDRGGIVGEVDITGCFTKHPSSWFCGPYGFTLANPKPVPFRPCKGALGFFEVR